MNQVNERRGPTIGEKVSGAFGTMIIVFGIIVSIVILGGIAFSLSAIAGLIGDFPIVGILGTIVLGLLIMFALDQAFSEWCESADLKKEQAKRDFDMSLREREALVMKEEALATKTYAETLIVENESQLVRPDKELQFAFPREDYMNGRLDQGVVALNMHAMDVQAKSPSAINTYYGNPEEDQGLLPEWTDKSLPQAILEAHNETIAVGQNRKGGEIAVWDYISVPHIRGHGATGSGKSAMIRTIAYQAIQKSHAVVWLDNSNFNGLKPFVNSSQMIDCDKPEMFLAALTWLVGEVKRRESLIMEYSDPVNLRSTDDYRSLPIDVKKDVPRMFIVIDEYAEHVAEASISGIDEDVTECIRRIARKGRKVGIHLVMGDQKPQSGPWDTGMKSNIEAVILARTIPTAVGSSLYNRAVPNFEDVPTKPYQFAYNQGGDQLIVGWDCGAEIEAFYHSIGGADMPSPVYMDLSGVEYKIEKAEAAQDKAAEVVPSSGQNKVRNAVQFILSGMADDMSKADIAEHLGVSLDTVSRARRLVSELDQDVDDLAG